MESHKNIETTNAYAKATKASDLLINFENHFDGLIAARTNPSAQHQPTIFSKGLRAINESLINWIGASQLREKTDHLSIVQYYLLQALERLKNQGISSEEREKIDSFIKNEGLKIEVDPRVQYKN